MIRFLKRRFRPKRIKLNSFYTMSNYYLLEKEELETMFQRAEQDDSEATFTLYLHYQTARRDASSGSYWLKKAARLEHPLALYHYAKKCLEGDSETIPINRELGISLLKKAKEKGNEAAEKILKELSQEND